MNYKLGKIKLETGVNNILNNSYFTHIALCVCMHAWVGGWMDGRTDGQTDRQTDR